MHGHNELKNSENKQVLCFYLKNRFCFMSYDVYKILRFFVCEGMIIL